MHALWWTRNHLVWFLQRDPVISVREDVDPIDEIQAQDETAEPPGFHYAAMREHQNEAAALKRFRQNITAKARPSFGNTHQAAE